MQRINPHSVMWARQRYTENRKPLGRARVLPVLVLRGLEAAVGFEGGYLVLELQGQTYIIQPV